MFLTLTLTSTQTDKIRQLLYSNTVAKLDESEALARVRFAGIQYQALPG